MEVAVARCCVRGDTKASEEAIKATTRLTADRADFLDIYIVLLRGVGCSKVCFSEFTVTVSKDEDEKRKEEKRRNYNRVHTF